MEIWYRCKATIASRAATSALTAAAAPKIGQIIRHPDTSSARSISDLPQMPFTNGSPKRWRYYRTPGLWAGERSALCGEAVAGAAHGPDQVVMAGGFQRLAQTPDVHVDGAFLHEYMITPYLVQQLGPGINPLGMCHQKV